MRLVSVHAYGSRTILLGIELVHRVRTQLHHHTVGQLCSKY